MNHLAEVQRQGLAELTAVAGEGAAQIASALEWGFGDITWRLQQQTEVLRSIDDTLKSPAETQANEWRKMAEELRRRGVLDEAEEFYLKALEVNRLDYRIYTGLAESYLQSNEFDRAAKCLQRSLPHAPKGRKPSGPAVLQPTRSHSQLTSSTTEFDWRSHSYRLIGHIHACAEDYARAAETLALAIELSPEHEESHYDYAQYCAQTGNTEACVSSLRKAILGWPPYWALAKAEPNFDPIRGSVRELLSEMCWGLWQRVKEKAAEAKSLLELADEPVSHAREALRISNEQAGLKSPGLYLEAHRTTEAAAEVLKLHPGDYLALLPAARGAEEGAGLASRCITIAHEEIARYRGVRAAKEAQARGTFGESAMITGCLAVLGWLLFGMGGCVVRQTLRSEGSDAATGAILGIVGGVLIAIWAYNEKLK